jgi:hypothetical protein
VSTNDEVSFERLLIDEVQLLLDEKRAFPPGFKIFSAVKRLPLIRDGSNKIYDDETPRC